MPTAEKITIKELDRWAATVSTYNQALRALARVYNLAFNHSSRTSHRALDLENEVREGHRYLVATTPDPNLAYERPLGFVSWRVWGEPRHQLAELTHIGVNPQEPAAHGLGRQLVAEMEEAAHRYYRGYRHGGARKIFILTHADNARAHNLYQRCGYREEARLPDFFRPGVDELYFSKTWPEHIAT